MIAGICVLRADSGLDEFGGISDHYWKCNLQMELLT